MQRYEDYKVYISLLGNPQSSMRQNRYISPHKEVHIKARILLSHFSSFPSKDESASARREQIKSIAIFDDFFYEGIERRSL